MTSYLKQLEKEHILIVGFASKTGFAVANYFCNKKIKYSVSDLEGREKVNNLINKLSFKPVNVFVGPQNSNQLKSINRIIISPGVPRTIPLLQEAEHQNIPVDTEISLSYHLIKGKKVKLIGITGTDGKSTTSALTWHLLKQKYNAYLLGNFGEPFITEINKLKKDDYVVLELSSYQLEDGEKYQINGATILNIAPDHLNRYESINHYRLAKEKIFINQNKKDVAVLNKDVEFYERWNKLVKANKVTISFNSGADIYLKDRQIVLNGKALIKVDEIPLKGNHNIENTMVAIAFAHYYGVDNDKILNGIKTFQGLAHRAEYIGNIKGIHFINDSKATTVQSVIKGLSCAKDNLVLILGGRDKNLDFTELNPYLKNQVKKIICYGEAGDKISKMIEFSNKLIIFNFDEAFNEAVKDVVNGDTILLSPGCTSWDQFSSFEERGKRFKELVSKYEKEIV